MRENNVIAAGSLFRGIVLALILAERGDRSEIKDLIALREVRAA